MKIFKNSLAIFLLIGLCACGSNSGDSGSTTAPVTTGSLVLPQDIPVGYDYPAIQVSLQAFADVYALTDMRKHSWNLWAGMTSPSNSSYDGTVLPIWETWCGVQEVFITKSCAILSSVSRGFEAPTQHSHLNNQGVLTPNTSTQVVAFNKFNPAMAAYLMKPQSQNGSLFDYTSGNGLVALNASWPLGTPAVTRSVLQAPYTASTSSIQGSAAIESKPVMLLIKAKGLTAMPLWRGPDDSWVPANPTPDTWKTCVLIDPNNSGPASTAPVPYNPLTHPGVINRQNTDNGAAGQTPGCSSANYLYAPIATLYTFPLKADSAIAFNTAQGAGAVSGDLAAVVAMHVSTKEITNWAWQTYWWQPGIDTPNAFPGSKVDMTANITGPWKNFAMCNALSQTKGTNSGVMNICFNPYLETSPGIPAGITSNCVSCHGMATAGVAQINPAFPITSLRYPASYTAPIDFNGVQFNDFTKLDFAWSMIVNASPPISKVSK